MPDYKIFQQCPICNKIFESYKCQHRQTCSNQCRWQYHKDKIRNGKYNTCIVCQQKYYVSKAKQHSKYCSLMCFWKDHAAKTKICKICGASMPWNKRTYCSRKCMAIGFKTQLKGANNPHWKGGSQCRDNSGVPIWLRNIILQRDKYQCQICGAKDWDLIPSLLHMHHIIPFRNGGTETENNLITLCFVCHWVNQHGYALNKPMQELASRTHCGDKSFWTRT